MVHNQSLDEKADKPQLVYDGLLEKIAELVREAEKELEADPV